MNFEDRVEQRRQNFMKSLINQPQFREDFQINLRKSKRQNFINSLRGASKPSQDISMINDSYFSNLILDQLKSLEYSSSNSDLSTKLQSINELISDKTIKTLQTNPHLTQKLSSYISIQTPDEVSYLVLKIILKVFKTESSLNFLSIPQLIAAVDTSKPNTSKIILKIFECYSSKSPENSQILIQANLHKSLFNLARTEIPEFTYSISLIYMHLICSSKSMKLQIFEQIIMAYKYLIQSNDKNILIVSLYSISQLTFPSFESCRQDN
jgi:hypothetical protein